MAVQWSGLIPLVSRVFTHLMFTVSLVLSWMISRDACRVNCLFSCNKINNGAEAEIFLRKIWTKKVKDVDLI